jgi:hypothetical protein
VLPYYLQVLENLGNLELLGPPVVLRYLYLPLDLEILEDLEHLVVLLTLVHLVVLKRLALLVLLEVQLYLEYLWHLELQLVPVDLEDLLHLVLPQVLIHILYIDYHMLNKHMRMKDKYNLKKGSFLMRLVRFRLKYIHLLRI